MKLNNLSAAFVQQFARDLYHCSSCNYCVDAVWPQRGIEHVCPTMEQHSRAPGYSGRGFIEAARAVLEGVALNAAQLGERVYTCTTCGNCESVCPLGLHPASIGLGLREELALAGCVPDAVARARERVLADANPFGVARAERDTWAAGAASASAARSVYFAGCAAAVARPDEARAGFDLMRLAGWTPELAPAGHCCGAPLAELGFVREAETLASTVAGRLPDPATRPVVGAGYECVQHLRGAGVEIMSLPAWLFGEVGAGRVKLALKSTVQQPLRVHAMESCQLKPRPGRRPIEDEQALRRLLDALDIACSNASYPSAYALCCGAAGGMPATQAALAARMAQARLPQAGIVISLDPRCAAHLRAAAGARATEVYGVAEFIVRYCDVTATPAAEAGNSGVI